MMLAMMLMMELMALAIIGHRDVSDYDVDCDINDMGGDHIDDASRDNDICDRGCHHRHQHVYRPK